MKGHCRIEKNSFPVTVLGSGDRYVALFCLFDSLRPINNLSVIKGLPGLNQYTARINVSLLKATALPYVALSSLSKTHLS